MNSLHHNVQRHLSDHAAIRSTFRAAGKNNSVAWAPTKESAWRIMRITHDGGESNETRNTRVKVLDDTMSFSVVTPGLAEVVEHWDNWQVVVTRATL